MTISFAVPCELWLLPQIFVIWTFIPNIQILENFGLLMLKLCKHQNNWILSSVGKFSFPPKFRFE